MAKFTRRLLELVEVRRNRSTAYHPQSDGQTEQMNQPMEQDLRIYCNYHQDDWSQLLPLAEFVYNNAKSASTVSEGVCSRCVFFSRLRMQ